MKNSYTHLFVSSAFGAILGASIAHYYAGPGPLGVVVHLLAMLAGMLTASLAVDHKGTAHILYLAYAGTIKEPLETGATAAVLCTIILTPFVLMCVLGKLIAKYLWLPIAPPLVAKLLDDSEPMNAFLTAFVFGGAMFAFFMVIVALRVRKSKSKDIDLLWRDAVVAPILVTPPGIAFAALWLIWKAVCNMRKTSKGICLAIAVALEVSLVTIGKTVLWLLKTTLFGFLALTWAIWAFFVYCSYGLTRCDLRSAAMMGAGTGMVVGWYYWSPLWIGLIGGTSAVTIHFFATELSKYIVATKKWTLEARPRPF